MHDTVVAFSAAFLDLHIHLDVPCEDLTRGHDAPWCLGMLPLAMRIYEQKGSPECMPAMSTTSIRQTIVRLSIYVDLMFMSTVS
jgi:hypothetical protein